MNETWSPAAPAGWYPDAERPGWLRYWSGAAWTTWLSDGTTVEAERRRVRALVPADTAHLDFVTRVFIPDARAAGLLDAAQAEALGGFAHVLAYEALQPQRARGVPPPRQWAPGPGAAAPVLAEPSTAAPLAVSAAELPRIAAPVAEPGPLARWWERTRQAVGSDLAVNGLAYLGVLLLFVGVFGLVAFAFGDVAPTMRPVAEAAIAAAPFLAAAMLLRRRAVIAGRALELAGGLLLPIMFMTSFLDGVAVPPDATGPVLVVTLTAGLAVISAGYAVWALRHPASALGYLVAPVAWLAVGIATMGVGRPIPAGEDVASATAVQVAAMAGAMVVTLALARWRSGARLAGPALTASVPGAAVVGLLALLTWWAEGWPAPLIGVTAVLGLGILDLLGVRLGDPVVAVLQPLWWAVAVLAMLPEADPARVGVLGAVVFAVVLEGNGIRRPAAWPLGLAAAGVVGTLALTWTEPWWTVGLLALATAWVVVRRLEPYAIDGATQALDVAAAVLPVATVVALGHAADDAALGAAVAAGLVLVATVPATRPLLRREPEETYWTRWWEAAVAGVAGAVAVVGLQSPGASTGQQWLLTAAVATLAVASAVGPLPVVWRPWPALALSTWAWLMACHVLSLPDVVRGGVLGLAGLLAVVVAHAAARRLGAPLAGSVGLSGHVLGTFALVTGAFAWGLVVVVAAATGGWLVTTWFDVRDRSPVGALLATAGGWLRYLPPVLAAVGLPVTALVMLHVSDVLPLTEPWAPAVLALTAVAYTAAVRVSLPGRISATLAWVGFAAGVLAAAAPAEPRPSIVGLAALIVAVAVLPTARRARPMVWTAWGAVAPLAGLVAQELSDAFAGLAPETALASTLVGVGGALAVGAAAADLRGRRWEPRWQPAHASVLPALAIGGAEVALGLVLALGAVKAPADGRLTAVVAATVLAVALLARVGALGGSALALGWLAAWLLAEDTILARPVLSVGTTTVLMLGAVLLGRLVSDRRWWVRWDMPSFAVANLTGATAVAAAVDGDAEAVTLVLVGVLAMGAAAWLRRQLGLASTYAGVGALLVLAGANVAGPGWLAAALAGLAVGLTLAASRVKGAWQPVLAAAGALAALGAAQQAGVWLELTSQRMVDLVSLGSALVALGWAVALRWRPALRMWALAWGGVTSLAVVGIGFLATSLGVLDYGEVAASRTTVLAAVGVAVAWAVAATPSALPGLRPGAMALVLGAQLEAAVVWDWTASTRLTVLSVTSLAAALLALGLRQRKVGRVWVPSVVGLGLVTAVAGLDVAARALPDLTLLSPALLVAAAQAAAVGVVLRSVGLRALSALLACGAWLAYAADALGGNAQWYTVPIGLALLVVVALVRQDARARGADPATAGIVVTELVGVGFLVGASFVQAVTESLAYTGLAVGLGLCVAAWGMVTKVRRRVVAGMVVVLAALVVLVGVPLVRMLPGWRGAGLWVLIAGAGLAALLVATLLEQGRSVVRRALAGFGSATEGWE